MKCIELFIFIVFIWMASIFLIHTVYADNLKNDQSEQVFSRASPTFLIPEDIWLAFEKSDIKKKIFLWKGLVTPSFKNGHSITDTKEGVWFK